jgi:hypothetical protein
MCLPDRLPRQSSGAEVDLEDNLMGKAQKAKGRPADQALRRASTKRFLPGEW